MKHLLILLALLFTIIQIHAQPIPQDTNDIVWQVKSNSIINSIIFSPDSKYVLVGTEGPHGIGGGTIEIRDIIDGSLIRTLISQDSGLYFHTWYMEFSHNGNFLLGTNYYGEVVIWDTKNWEKIKILKYKYFYEYPRWANFSPDDSKLAIAAENEGIIIYNTNTWEIEKEITDFPFKWDPQNGGSPKAFFVKYNQDGTKLLFSGDWTFIYDLSLDTIIHQFPISQTPTYSPDYKQTGIMQGNPAEVFIYNSETYEQENRITLGGNKSFNFVFSPDGKNVITSGDNGKLQIWDLVTLKEIYNFHFDFPYSLRHPAISNDGQFIAIESGYLILLKPKITSVEENKQKILRTLYPNPTTQIVTIELNLNKSEEIIIDISDITGKNLNSINYGLLDAGNKIINYNASILSTGIYYITIHSQSFYQTFKLVKE